MTYDPSRIVAWREVSGNQAALDNINSHLRGQNPTTSSAPRRHRVVKDSNGSTVQSPKPFGAAVSRGGHVNNQSATSTPKESASQATLQTKYFDAPSHAESNAQSSAVSNQTNKAVPPHLRKAAEKIAANPPSKSSLLANINNYPSTSQAGPSRQAPAVPQSQLRPAVPQSRPTSQAGPSRPHSLLPYPQTEPRRPDSRIQSVPPPPPSLSQPSLLDSENDFDPQTRSIHGPGWSQTQDSNVPSRSLSRATTSHESSQADSTDFLPKQYPRAQAQPQAGPSRVTPTTRDNVSRPQAQAVPDRSSTTKPFGGPKTPSVTSNTATSSAQASRVGSIYDSHTPMNSGIAAKSAKPAAEFPCSYEHCTMGFSNYSALKKHKYQEHDGYCKRCDIDTEDSQTLLEHKRTSLKHISCQYCGEDFKSESGRNLHEVQVSHSSR